MAQVNRGAPAATDSEYVTRSEAIALGALKSSRWAVASDASWGVNNVALTLSGTPVFNQDTALYAASGGGVKVATAGYYLVLAGVQFAANSNSGYRDINVRTASSSGTSGSVVGESSGFSTGSELRVAAAFMAYIAAAQVVTLCAASDASSVTAKAGNNNSWLSLTKVA